MKKILSALMVAVALLLLGDAGGDEPLRIGENLRRENVLLPYETPDKSQLVVTDYVMVEEEGGGVGIMVFYDDPRTKLDIDYVELYGVSGDLLLVTWIDRFGVCQVAIDRALLASEPKTLDGVLVLITGGTAS
ncbi:MAG TPA: hypothetical protein VIE89_31120 [Candidatus Binatia bacterium]